MELILAILAILTQPTPPPADFVAGLQWAAPISTGATSSTSDGPATSSGFVGLIWICDPAELGDYGPTLNALDLAELRAAAIDPDNDLAETCRAGYDAERGLITAP